MALEASRCKIRHTWHDIQVQSFPQRGWTLAGVPVEHSATLKLQVDVQSQWTVTSLGLQLGTFWCRVAEKNCQKHNGKVGDIFHRVRQRIDDHVQALVSFERPHQGKGEFDGIRARTVCHSDWSQGAWRTSASGQICTRLPPWSNLTSKLLKREAVWVYIKHQMISNGISITHWSSLCGDTVYVAFGCDRQLLTFLIWQCCVTTRNF